MKKGIFLAMAAAIIIAGCGRTGKAKEPVTDRENASLPERHAVTLPDDTGSVKLTVREGHSKATVTKKEGQNVTFSFDAAGYSHLSGRLVSADTMANIRFTQIFMPDGEADGPFGREIDYALTQQGTYELSVGENTMAGDPWTGEFTISLELTRRSGRAAQGTNP